MIFLKGLLKIAARTLYVLAAALYKKKKVVCLINSEEDTYGNIVPILNELKNKNIDTDVINGIKFNLAFNDLFKIARAVIKLSKAKIIICDTTYPLLGIINFGKNSEIIYVGHGGGAIKKMGFSRPSLGRSEDHLNRLYGQFSWVIATTQNFDKELMLNYHIAQERILHYGFPRTDDLVRSMRANINQVKDIQRVLVAPTWDFGFDKKNIKNLLKQAPDNLKLRFRLHPNVERMTRSMNDDIIWADILITDASSIMLDYSLTEKPIIVVKIDEKFKKRFWIFPSELPGVNVANTYEEALEMASKGISIKHSKELKDKHMNNCDGFCTQRISNFISERIDQK